MENTISAGAALCQEASCTCKGPCEGTCQKGCDSHFGITEESKFATLLMLVPALTLSLFNAAGLF